MAARQIKRRTGRRTTGEANFALLRLGCVDHLPVGLSAFCVIEAVAIGWALLEVARSRGGRRGG